MSGADADWLDWWRMVGPDHVAHLARADMAPGETLCGFRGRPADEPRFNEPGVRRWRVESICPACITAAGVPREPVQEKAQEPAPTYTIEQAEAIILRRDLIEACALDLHRPVHFTYGLTGVCACGTYEWTAAKAAPVTDQRRR